MRTIFKQATATVIAWALIAPMAMGQDAKDKGGGERVGENVGQLLGGWAKSLYVGIAALVALMFLLNRRFADLAVFLFAALIVGGFVLAPTEGAGAIKTVLQTHPSARGGGG